MTPLAVITHRISKKPPANMSHSKRRRIEDEESHNDADKASLDLAMERIAHLRELISDTLLHDTYCPIILKFFSLREVLSSMVLISKYHHNLVFNHPASLSLCRSLAFYDFGTFITSSPYAPYFRGKEISSPKDLIDILYHTLPQFIVDKTEPTSTPSTSLHSTRRRANQ